MSFYLSFDLGGTNLKYAIVNGSGNIVQKGKMPTPRTKIEDFVNIVSELKNKYSHEYVFDGIAMSLPGAVNNTTGFVGGISAVPYIHGPNIRELITGKTGLPVFMENDANCAALAEVWRGVAKECKDVLFVVCGTGIGGAVIKDRKLHVGKNLHGGEFGFMIMDKDFESGKYRSWSDTGSTAALVRSAAKRKGIPSKELDGELVFKFAEEKDDDCIRAIDEWYMYLAMGIFNLQYIYDPEMIVMGGAVSARENIVDEINQRLNRLVEDFGYAKIFPRVEKCQFSNDANIIGAVYGAMHK